MTAERSARLTGAFRERAFPVILVNVAGRAPGRTEARFNLALAPDWTEFVPELNQQPEDYIVIAPSSRRGWLPAHGQNRL